MKEVLEEVVRTSFRNLERRVGCRVADARLRLMWEVSDPEGGTQYAQTFLTPQQLEGLLP